LTWQKEERIRAFRRIIGLVEGLIAAFNEFADELAEAEDEVADAAMLSIVGDWLACKGDGPRD
jgi:hypothetical protein